MIEDNPFGPDEMGVSVPLPLYSLSWLTGLSLDMALADHGLRPNSAELLSSRAYFLDSRPSTLLEALSRVFRLPLVETPRVRFSVRLSEEQKLDYRH